jgi:hypothetical protein
LKEMLFCLKSCFLEKIIPNKLILANKEELNYFQ